MKDYKEQVLVVPKKYFNFKHTGIYPFNKDLEGILSTLSTYSHYVQRNDVETDSNYLQLIPYIIFRVHRADSETDTKYFTYIRTKSGAEDRLHQLISCGIGGHINLCDNAESLKEIIQNCIKRELKEEVGFEVSTDALNYCGLIYDPTNSVGEVHLGILVLVDIPEPIYFKEGACKEISYLDYKTASQILDLKTESWTKLSVEYLQKFET